MTMHSRSQTRTGLLAIAATAVALLAGNAHAQTYTYQVNINGATLFSEFFSAPGSTNDYIDANGNGVYGYTAGVGVDQLAETYTWTGNTFFNINYRGVGSGNGLKDLDNYYGSMAAPVYTVDADPGYVNRTTFTTPNSPVTALRADIAVMDVPTLYFVQSGDAADASWNATPGSSGYGMNGATSTTGQSNGLKTLTNLNTNTDNPDEYTVFDTPIATVPIAFIANRGAGLENITQSELQYLFTTGRSINGENLNVATRDSGSGTRNGAMNSIGVDPSWGVGDNIGVKEEDKLLDPLGESHKVSNLSSSSRMEERVSNNRLSIGYTGLSGSSHAAGEQEAGMYEILNVCMDQEGGTLYVRPTVESIVVNGDVDTGYRIVGNETMATVGDPTATVVSTASYTNSGNANTGTVAEMTGDRVGVALYIQNILASLAAFEGDPGDNENWYMPGELLAQGFFLPAGMDYNQDLYDPTTWTANADLNEVLQQYMLDNVNLGTTSGDTRAYGSANAAGLCPTRSVLTSGTYSDGTDGSYYIDAAGNSVYGDSALSARNEIAGDFDNDGVRNAADAAKLIEAVLNPRNFEAGMDHGGDAGDMAGDFVIVEVIGDFNADGDFDSEDVRFFADGLAMDTVTGKLNRQAGFTNVDAAFGGNYFGTTLATGKTYAYGDSRADIAGNDVSKGAAPTGADGVVDAADIDSVFANFGDWSVIDEAINMDLSADMNGDLVVDVVDVDTIVQDVLGTEYGDANLDRKVDINDLIVLAGTYGSDGGWADGDTNGDGSIDINDLIALAGNYGQDYTSVPTAAAVPEPATLSALGLGALALIRRRRRE